MRRHLPLLAAPFVANAAPSAGARLPAPGAIGLADTGSGEQAATFAAALARALSVRGVRVEVMLIAYDAVPSPEPSLHDSFAASGSTLTMHAIDRALPALPAPLVAHTLVLLVGVPALASFAPDLALLLGASRPLSSWPEALRLGRAGYHAELGAPRAGLAEALAESLIERDFLPRG